MNLKVGAILIFILNFGDIFGLNILRQIELKVPIIREAVELATDIADFTLSEILNFQNFKSLFHKVYNSKEEENRGLLNFLINQRDINEHNELFEDGLVSFSRAPFEHSDMSPDDVNQLINKFTKPIVDEAHHLQEVSDNFDDDDEEYEEEEEEESEEYEESVRRKRQIGKVRRKRLSFYEDEEEELEYLNYAEDGYVNEIQDQGVCGSCWSFSSVSALEAACFRKTGRLLKLSEQQLIDCNHDPENGNYGCSGGDMLTAFTYLESNGGLTLASKYPYLENDTFVCQKVRPLASVAAHKHIQPGNEELLKKYLIKFGPIAIALDASLKSFQSYKSGIYYDPECTANVNHAMLLVGFGTATIKVKNSKVKQDYWIVRNTYGELWGEDGYMRIARNKDNHCGVTEFAVVVKCE